MGGPPSSNTHLVSRERLRRFFAFTEVVEGMPDGCCSLHEMPRLILLDAFSLSLQWRDFPYVLGKSFHFLALEPDDVKT